MQKKNIFVTGGNGFIGRNIIENLGKKYNFYAPSHEDLDLLNPYPVEKFFKTYKIDVVIHAAKFGGTRKVQDTPDLAKMNLKMFFNVVRNKKHFGKMIFIGTGGEYDASKPLIKVKESEFDKVIPSDNFFGLYKYICSKYIEEADNIVNLRLFGIYGKYEDYQLRFISNAICKNLFNLPITMRQNVFFDYVYIDDFVRIVDYFINNNPKEKFYNIGTGKKIDLLTIAKIINEISDKKSKIIVKKNGLNREYTCDNSRLKKEIKGIKFTDFDQTLKFLLQWYKNIIPDLNKKSFLVDK